MSIPSILLFALGAAVYAVTMWDVLKTTLSMHGGGPLTDRLMRGIDAVIRRSGEKEPRDTTHGIVRYSNLALTVAIFVMWFGGLLLAATLMLSADEDSVSQVSEGNAGPMWLNRVYFVGASLTTAGFGDFVPNGVHWQALTVLVASSGLVVTSLGISYVVSTVTAVVAQRALARRITDLGRSPEDILGAHFRDGGFADVGSVVDGLAGDLVTHTQRHLAYPAIHYVRADDDRDCLPAAIALLDETLTILLYEVPAEALPPRHQLFSVRRAVTAYLESLRADFVEEIEDDAPDWPAVDFLARDFGLAPARRGRHLDDGHAERLAQRRRYVRAAVRSQGIDWDRLGEYLETPEEDWLDGDAAALIDGDSPAG